MILGAAEFATSYEISPIVLLGGSALNSGSQIPIVNLLQAAAYAQGLVSSATPPDLNTGGTPTGGGTPVTAGGGISVNSYFAKFTVPPGGTLIDNDIAHFPLANQATAANAVISKPLHVTLKMICPAGTAVSYSAKQSVITNLQNKLSDHIAAGGWFNVATPSYIYQNMLLLSLRDVSQVVPGGQVQTEWEWEFEQPIITQQGADKVTNQAMTKGGSGTEVAGDPPLVSTIDNTAATPYSPVAQSLVPSAQRLAGAAITPAPSRSVPAFVSGLSS
jgi:hypothetical protein